MLRKSHFHTNPRSPSFPQQIQNQIKTQILSGELSSDELLPSIRVLAKELKVSIITTKRAYEELEKEGYIITVAGKGSYVCSQSTERLKEAALYEMESKLEEIIISAKKMGINEDEFIEIIKNIYMEV